MVLTLTILDIPMAKTMVTTAGRPSGMAATAKAMACMNSDLMLSLDRLPLIISGISHRMPTMNMAMTMTTQMRLRILPSWANFF